MRERRDRILRRERSGEQFGVVETHTQRESDCSRVIITKCVSQRKALKVSPKRVSTPQVTNSSVFQHIMSHHRGGAGGNQHLHYDGTYGPTPPRILPIFHRLVSGRSPLLLRRQNPFSARERLETLKKIKVGRRISATCSLEWNGSH